MLEQILWTASVTPFDSSGKGIDYNSFELILRRQAAAGNGVILFGSTGEGLSVSATERQQMATFAVSLNLGIPLIMGVPSYHLETALEWLDFCRDLPLAGYLMTTPMYTKPGIKGQTAWFEKLLDRAQHPAMLYNIPGRAATKLHNETVTNLQKHPRFVAIKDSGGTVESLVDYKIAAPEIAVFCGDDYMMASMASEGAVGLVSVASNAWPVATRRYVQQILSGKQVGAKLWWQAGRALFSASNPIAVKALLHDVGIISTPSVRLPLSLEDLPSRQPLLNLHEQMLHWGE